MCADHRLPDKLAQVHAAKRRTNSHVVQHIDLADRNLYDVFGENDPARRRAAIDEIFTDDCVFYDPMGGVYRRCDEIHRIAGTLRASHPDLRYQPTAEPEEVGNGGGGQKVRSL